MARAELEIVAQLVVDAMCTNDRFGVTVIVHDVDGDVPSIAVASSLNAQAQRRDVLTEALALCGGPPGRMYEAARALAKGKA